MPVGDPQFGELRRCPCKAAEDIRGLQQLSGLTEPELQRRLADIETEGRPGTARMVAACREFLEHPAGVLTIWGGVGNAKTMALHAVVNELIARKTAAVYVTAFDLLGYVRAAFDDKRAVSNESAHKRLSRFEHIAVLALDEFDKRYDTDWAVRQLTDLIDKRYRFGEAAMKGTLIVMNSNPAEQPEWIASRLLDGRNRVVHNEDSDIRPALRR